MGLNHLLALFKIKAELSIFPKQKFFINFVWIFWHIQNLILYYYGSPNIVYLISKKIIKLYNQLQCNQLQYNQLQCNQLQYNQLQYNQFTNYISLTHNALIKYQLSGFSIQNNNLAPNTTLSSTTYSMQQKHPIVCMTGFINDCNTPHYQQMLQSLGCKYMDILSHGTDILIVNKTSTQKYQMAELPTSKAQSVTINWLQDSYKAGQLQNILDYKIPSIFHGVTVGIAGFDEDKQGRLTKILLQNGGIVQKIQINLQIKQMPDVIITNKNYLRKVEIYICRFQIPIVQIDWLEQSLKHKICKFPANYAMNYQNIPTNLPMRNIKRLNKKVSSFIQMPCLNNMPAMIFSNQCLIYLDNNSISRQLQSICKKLINLNDGMYLEFINPALSHILVGSLTEKQYTTLVNEANSTQIYRIQWLIDSILFGCRMSEIDYKIRSFRGKFRDHDQMQKTYNTSQSLGHNSLLGLHRQSSLNNINNNSNRKTVLPLNLMVEAQKSIKIIKTKAIKTEIFKNKIFFIEYRQRKQPQMASIPTKIKQNGGAVYDGPKKGHKNYLVMKDSVHNQQILSELCDASTGRYKKIEIIPVSIRWIEYCVKKSMFIENNLDNFLIFKPFNFNTPLTDFMSMKIEILCVDDIFKARLRQLLAALGNHKISPNKSELTHCLCGRNSVISRNKYNKFTEKYDEICKQNKIVKFVRYEWLIDIINNNGSMLPCEQYQIVDADVDVLQDGDNKMSPTVIRQCVKTPEKSLLEGGSSTQQKIARQEQTAS